MNKKKQVLIDEITKKKQALIDKITKIAHQTIIDPPEDSIDFVNDYPFSIIPFQDSVIFIPRQMYLELEKFCQEMLKVKKEWQDKYSEEYVGELLTPLIFKVARESSKEEISNTFDQVVNSLDTYSEEQIVLLPLTHIQIDSTISSNISFGSFTLCRASEDNLHRLQAYLDTPHQIDMLGQLYHQTFLSGRQYAQFHIVAEPSKAMRQAEIKFQPYSDLLRYTIDSLEERGQVSSLNFLGGGVSYGLIAFSKLQITNEARGTFSLASFNITQERLKQMEQMGIFHVADIIAKETKTKFEETLLRGIHWFANALVQTDNYNKFLSLVISAEVFFSTKDVDRIGQTVSEGIAFFLGENKEKRKELKTKFNKFYQLRGKVAHGDQSSISDIEVNNLKDIVKKFLSEMINRTRDQTNHFENKDDLVMWIEEQKFG